MKVCKVLNPGLHIYVLRLNKILAFGEYRVADENLNKIFFGYQVEDLFYILEENYAKFDEKERDWLLYCDQEYQKRVIIPYTWYVPIGTWYSSWGSKPNNLPESTEPKNEIQNNKNEYKNNNGGWRSL